ncbi:MAG: hypothetical protein V3T77_05695 [Planctomycetota bacterium]
MPCLLWAVLCALVLGVVGFRSMQRGLVLKTHDSVQVTRILLFGVVLRVLILAGSQGLVYLISGKDWGNRALLATAVFYVSVLMIEVYTLAQSMGIFTPRRTPEERGNGEEKPS